jgi:signal transduction histidine kinase
VAFGGRGWRSRRKPAPSLLGGGTARPGSPAAQPAEARREACRPDPARDEERKTAALVQTAGLAEVATSVLHNVGNVLNSVSVSCTCVVDSLRRSKVSNLARVVDLLREHESDLGGFFTHDPRARKVPGFLAQLADRLVGERDSALRELTSLQHSVEHIKQIVASQQSCAAVGGVIETLPLAELIEDALQLNAAAFDRQGIEIVRAFDPQLDAVAVDRHRILQILINLIRNAQHAMDAPGAPGRRLTIRTARVGRDGFVIEVRDEGLGIAPEQLGRIFQRGFTTKKGGHGFGLHSSALAAREMGGALRVESPGRGCGAAFTLELPLVPHPSTATPSAA